MSVAENLKTIRKKITDAAKEAGRDPADIHLVAVSKKQPETRIREALAAGQRIFGENRVQEAQRHWAELKNRQGLPTQPSPRRGEGNKGETAPSGKKTSSDSLSPGGEDRKRKTSPAGRQGNEGETAPSGRKTPSDFLLPGEKKIKLHLVGPLQTNKVKDAVALFDVIETLDREKLARKLSKEMEKQGRALPCFIQVNTGLEEQKAGIAPEALPDFFGFCRGECGLDIQGLMCIPPIDEPAALHFALLKKLAGETGLGHLSMGMSADFEKAIALGATHIRLGTAVFGKRI